MPAKKSGHEISQNVDLNPLLEISSTHIFHFGILHKIIYNKL